MTPVEAGVSAEPITAPTARKPAPSLFARCSGTLVSMLVHGAFILAAFLSVAAPRTGRGGGIVGRPDGGPGEPSYSALVQRSDTVSGERQADVRAFEAPTDEPVAPDAVPPPELDFLNEPAETGVPVPKLPPRPETESHARSKGAYSKLPPSTGSQGDPSETPPPAGGSGPKGNSNVSGTGGDTGGAGDGTVGALFMPAPEYPSSARRKGIEGIVVVTIDVLPDGTCARAQIVESSGCEALDDAAVAAIRKWKYEAHPAEPPSVRRVRFVFRLQK